MQGVALFKSYQLKVLLLPSIDSGKLFVYLIARSVKINVRIAF